MIHIEYIIACHILISTKEIVSVIEKFEQQEISGAARYSEGSLFRRFVISKVRFSENEIGFDIPKVR